jgi:hypothetical protein
MPSDPVADYLNNYDLSEGLALLKTHGTAVTLTYVDGTHWHCEATVDARKVTGYGAEPHTAVNMAWASCYQRVSFGELIMGTGKKPVTLADVAAAAPSRALRSKLIDKGPSPWRRFKNKAGQVRDKIKGKLTTDWRFKQSGGGPHPNEKKETP